MHQESYEAWEGELFRLLVENVQDYAIFAIDQHGQVLSWSQGAERLLGYAAHEIVGKDHSCFFLPEDVAAGVPQQEMTQALAMGRGDDDRWHRRKDGSRFWASGVMTPLRDHEGKLRGFAKIMRDLTHRKLQEEALAEQVRMAAFGRDIGLAMVRNDDLPEMLKRFADTIVREMDVALARIWIADETESELVLRASAGMYTHLDGFHSRIPVGQQKIGRIAASRQPQLTNEVQGDAEFDDPRWAEMEGIVAFAGYPLVVDQRLVGVIALFARRPLSGAALEAMASVANAIAVGVDRKTVEHRAERELQASEKRKAAILQTALDSIITIDHQARVVDFNPAAERMFGYSYDEAVGRDVSELIIPHRLRSAHRAGIARYLRSGDSRVLNRRIELPAIGADGREFPVELAITCIATDDHPLFTAYVRDISERVRIDNLRSARLAVTSALAEAPNVAEAIPAVLHAVCDGLHWDIGFFWMLDRRRKCLICQQSWHRSGLPLVEFETRSREWSFAFNEGLPGHVWASGQPTWISELTEHADFPRAELAAKEGLHSAFAVPVIVSHECLGVIEFFNQEIRRPDDDLLEMMATVAGQVAQYIERKRAEDDLREQTLVAESLNRVGRRLAAEVDLESIVRVVIDESTGLSGAAGGVLYYYAENDRDQLALCSARAGDAADALVEFLTAPRNSELFDSTLRGETVVHLDDMRQASGGEQHATSPAGRVERQETGFERQRSGAPWRKRDVGRHATRLEPRAVAEEPAQEQLAAATSLRSYLAVPVVSRRGKPVGSLFLAHHQPGVFQERHERILLGVATQAATAIEKARLYQRTHESEERFRQLAEQIDDVFWMLDPHKSQMLYVSPAYEHLSGRSRESLYADSLSFIESIHPDDRRRVLDVQENYSLGIATSLEYRVIRPDGAVRWLWDRAFPIQDASGRVYRVAGIAEDVTERKQAEDATRFLADASTSLAAIVDYESTLQTVAGLAVPTFADWCAVDLAEPDGSLRRLAVVHADPVKVELATELARRYPNDVAGGTYHVLRTGQPKLVQDLSDELLSEVASDETHLEMLRRLGLKSYMCVPLQTRNITIGVLIFAYAESGRRYEAHDLALATELARRAAVAIENARLYAALRDADRRKDEFLAMLAHELRNPLAPIRTGLDILAMSDQPQPETVQLMQQQVGHLVRLVDDLLDVSRIVRGRVELRCEPVDLSSIVRRSVDAMRPTLESRQQKVAIVLQPEPLWLDADPVRLIQVVENLLNNASKYMDSGGRVEIRTERRGGKAVVSIQDEGIGIDPDLLPNVFDLFTQSARSLDRSQGGLGIGLTLVRNLVEMHGGEVAVFSEGPGKGSRFEVSLPIAPSKEESKSVSEQMTESKGRRILVVDDNVGAAKMLTVLLKRLGPHEIEMAHDGPSTIDVAERFRPEIILLDIGLPRMDGLTVAWTLRQSGKFDDTLLAALTGYGQEEDRRRSKEAGFDEHLVKPVDVQTLRQLLCHPKLSRTV